MSAGSGNQGDSGESTPSAWEAEIASVRVLFGDGRLTEAAQLVEVLGARRVLLVSDPGLRAAGHLDRLEATLRDADLEVVSFTEVGENPDTLQVDQGAELARAREPECVVALGGGSAMDCAKGINFLLTNGGQMADYQGYGRTTRALLPSIGLPTTAGTGSEAQSFALITDARSHCKMACGDPSARFRSVILDPTLLDSVPTEVAATAGMDAVSHAIESFVSTAANPVSRLFAQRSWQLLQEHLIPSLAPGADSSLRGQTLLAAHLAGAAIEQSMLGAAHACANPLTATFGIPHGRAVILMLPAVMRFNAQAAEQGYAALARAAGLAAADATASLVRRIEEMREQAGLAGGLAGHGIARSAIPDLAAAAIDEWTGTFNPRPVDRKDFETLYEAAY